LRSLTKRGIGEVKPDILSQLHRQRFCNLVNPLRRLAQFRALSDFEKNHAIVKFDIHPQKVRSPGIGSNHGARLPLFYLPVPASLSRDWAGAYRRGVLDIALDQLSDQSLCFHF
jgi:hypothetical protein